MFDSWRARARWSTGLAVVGVGVALAVVVLPALANGGGGGPIPPASGKGITPTSFSTGGKTTDCSLFKSTAPYSYQITSPTTKTYSTTAPNGLPVTFALTVASDKKTFGFTSTGSAVYDVSSAPRSDDEHDDDDPTGTAWYQYSKASTGPVANDTALHTTKDKKGVLHTVYRVTFCYATVASISGRVFNQSGNAGLAGWTVNLYKAGSTTPTTATTGSTGAYTFTNVSLGSTYNVCLVSQTGWQQTSPTSGTACGSNENPYGYTTPTLIKNITSGLDFGNAQLATISGHALRGGSPQSGETLNLYKAGASTPITATTGADGSYSFTNQPVGVSYKVCEAQPAGSWEQTSPTTSTGDHTACGSGEFPVGYQFTLGSGGSTNRDFDIVQLASISGTAFNDLNNNGTNDAGDSLQSGLTVSLYQTGGSSTPIATQSTTGSGSYEFTVPITQQGYTVCETPPASDWSQTLPVTTTTDQVTCHTGEFPLGYGIALTAAGRTGLDFGSVQTIAASCTDPFGTDPNYQAQLDCTDTSKTFVQRYSDADGNKYASLQRPFGTETSTVPIIEEITWTLPGDAHQLVVKYNDDPLASPTNPGDLKLMRTCNIDPRDPAGGDGFVIATTSGVLPDGETSCIVKQSTVLPPVTVPGEFTVFIYSSVDGLRFGGP